MINNKKLKDFLIYSYIIVSLLLFVVILVIPTTRAIFEDLSKNQPYIMGFIKFALLATAGELIASYVISPSKTVPVKIVFRFLIWGLIGIWITFMMKVFSNAVATMMASGQLLGGDSIFLKAFYTSLIMNTTFGPTFMAIHKITDKLLELWDKKESCSLKNVVTSIDWSTFCSFTILKTVPFFWIPAHTITFLLPVQYQVMMAAGLSVALGIMLSLSNRKKANKEAK